MKKAIMNYKKVNWIYFFKSELERIKKRLQGFFQHATRQNWIGNMPIVKKQARF